MNSYFLNKKIALYMNFDTNLDYEENKRKIDDSMLECCKNTNVKEYVDIGFRGKNRRRNRYNAMIRDIETLGIEMIVVYNLEQFGKYPARLNKVIDTLYDKKVIIYSLEDKKSLVHFSKKELSNFKEYADKYLTSIISNKQKKIQKEAYYKKHKQEFRLDNYEIREFRKNFGCDKLFK